MLSINQLEKAGGFRTLGKTSCRKEENEYKGCEE